MNFLILALTVITVACAHPQFFDFDVDKSLSFDLNEPLFDAPSDEKKDSSQKVSGSGSYVAKKFEPAPEAAFQKVVNDPNLYYSPSSGRYKPLEEHNPLEKRPPKKNKELPKFEGAASKFDEPHFKNFESPKFEHSYKPLENSESFVPKFEHDEYGYSPKQSYVSHKPSKAHSHSKNSLPSYDGGYKPLDYSKSYVPKYDLDDFAPSHSQKQNRAQVKVVSSDPFEGHEPKSAFDDAEPKSTFDEVEPKESFVAPESGSTKDNYDIPDIPKDAFKDAYGGSNKEEAFEVPKEAAFGEQGKDEYGFDSGYGDYEKENSAPPKVQHEQIAVKQVKVQKPVQPLVVATTASGAAPLGFELSFDKGRKEDVYKSIYDERPVEREQESRRKVKHKQETREDVEHEEESRQEFKRPIAGGEVVSHSADIIGDQSLFGGNDHSKGLEHSGAHTNNHEYHSGEHLTHNHGSNHGRSHGSHANIGSGSHGSHVGHTGHHGSHGSHGSHVGHTGHHGSHGSHGGSHHGSHGNLGSNHHSSHGSSSGSGSHASHLGSHGSHSHHQPQASNSHEYDTSSNEGGSHETSYETGNEGQQTKGEPLNANTFYDPQDPVNHKVESRKEYKRGDHVIGEYTAKGSDGVYRKVKYQSGPHTGFETVYNVQAVAAPRGST